MIAACVNYVHVWARYETKDHTGLTRRERNQRGGAADKSPPLWLHPDYLYLVEWFWELRSFCKDRDYPITPGLISEWRAEHGIHLEDWHRQALYAMDRKFRATLSEEIAANEERRMAQLERQSKSKGRR